MFGRQISCHGRRMDEIRSAQQKCVRRCLEEGLILLNLEHLLTVPDFSRAAISRMQVIAAEDIGVAAPDLCARLLDLSEGWEKLEIRQKARRLIQASKLCTQTEASRFVPHWAITLVTGVGVIRPPEEWPTQAELLAELQENLEKRKLQEAGLAAEAIFLRHPIGEESELPKPIHLEKKAMGAVWRVILQSSPWPKIARYQALQTLFGTAAKETISSRLFLYLAIADRVFAPESQEIEIPEVSEAEVEGWLERAKAEAYAIPDWMLDKHTARGRQKERGQAQFLEEASRLEKPSALLGGLEAEMYERSKAIYLAEEERYGRSSRTQHIRQRWREAVSMAQKEESAGGEV